MSQTTPHSPRHALADHVEPPTTAIPVPAPAEIPVPAQAEIPGEFTDDATQAIPVIPVQQPVPPPRTAPPSWPSAPSMPAQRRPGDDRMAPQGPPAGVYPGTTVPPAPHRSRVLPAVLAGVTACLLAAGIVVGVGGAAGTDMTDPPSTSGTP